MSANNNICQGMDKLLVNEKVVGYKTMIEVLAKLKSPCTKRCHLTLKVEPIISRVYLP